jgi:preprotein translocase SecE subunit
MATAVETSSQSQAPSPPAGLVTASFIGAVYVFAALAVVLYAVPAIWTSVIGESLAGNTLLEGVLKATLKLAVIIGLGWFGMSLAGANPPRGLRGGVFLIVACAALIFTIVCWIGTSVEGMPGQIFTAIIGAAMLFGAFRLITSPRGERWMVGLEDQGWFHAKSYKRVLGLRVRRLTILGILLLFGSGVYALIFHGGIENNLTVHLPFTQQDGAPEGTQKVFVLLTDAKYALPIILLAAVIWFAWRMVNVPTFAEFLIATEAEMNKVSWTSRKRLTQDTIVVLVTTILMAVFLLLVDLFWGWLLSTSLINVLPAKPTKPQNTVHEAKW